MIFEQFQVDLPTGTTNKDSLFFQKLFAVLFIHSKTHILTWKWGPIYWSGRHPYFCCILGTFSTFQLRVSDLYFPDQVNVEQTFKTGASRQNVSLLWLSTCNKIKREMDRPVPGRNGWLSTSRQTDRQTGPLRRSPKEKVFKLFIKNLAVGRNWWRNVWA